METDDGDQRTYIVVVNREEQYSISLFGEEVPSGWRPVGKRGTKSDCLDFVDGVWTDITPLSVRRSIDAFETKSPPESTRTQC
jgi:MbtH protein